MPTIGQGRHKRYTQDAVEIIDFISKSFSANLPADEIAAALDARYGHVVELDEVSPTAMPPQSAAIIQKIIQDAVHEALAEQSEALRQLHAELEATKALLEQRNEAENKAERERRVTDFITQTRVLTLLQTEALDEWLKLPRGKRGGLFREDSTRRDAFIQKYVHEHLAERIQKEYGLTSTDNGEGD